MTRRYVTAKDVQNDLMCSRYTLWRMVRDGQFPRPTMIRGLRRWPEKKVRDAIARLAGE